jgi:signal transduction histidine kinase
MKTLRFRLNMGLGIILVGGVGVQWGLQSIAMPYIVEQEVVTRLSHDADAIKRALRFDPTGHAHVDMDRQAPIYSQSHSGHYFILEDAGEPAVPSPSLGDHHLQIAPLFESGRQVAYAEGPLQQPLLVLVQAFRVDDHQLTLTVGEDLTAIRRDISNVGWIFLGLNGLVILMALLIQWFFVSRALRPYLCLRRELSQIAEGDEESAVSAVEPDALPPVDEIRRLMQLLNRRIKQSRTAIGNLAHALKTPLAILYRLADDPALQTQPALARDIKQHSNTIHKLIERELTRARLAGTASPGSRFNPRDELSALIKVLRTIYADKTLNFEIDAPEREIPYDRQDMLELLGNLLDNASKWAQSRVAISIRHHGGLSIRVEDDGPGCTAAELARLGQRGLKLDESKEGQGLGLSIVRDIVEFYGGTVDYGQSRTLGGFSAVIQIPDSHVHNGNTNHGSGREA